ncbi:hypothetical protein [Lactobacillus bombicola]|uniref:hypothetical protein n=1 Tax=Lactobacillus bombicola TaxID=1505723 RepID=UPI0015F83B5F|nr:hypothetical protein [Lactobacillus bombicola]
MTATNQAISGHAATVASSVYDANETPIDKPGNTPSDKPHRVQAQPTQVQVITQACQLIVSYLHQKLDLSYI